MQESDRKVINWFGENQLHFTVVLTKTDKLSTNQLASNYEAYKRELLKDWEQLPPFILTSARLNTGKGEILSFIEKTNKLFKPGQD
jgi:GTP-binding protein